MNRCSRFDEPEQTSSLLILRKNMQKTITAIEVPGVPPERIPGHVAFIMDGNGRWAKMRGKDRFEGHLRGAQTVLKVVESSFRMGIQTVTLYAFSTENQNRPTEEIAALMHLLKTFLDEYVHVLLENEICLRVIGDLTWLPSNISGEVRDILSKTKDFKRRTLVVALNYSSRDELLRAASAFAKDVKSGCVPARCTKWEDFAQYLDTRGIPDPDLIVRTSGELRLSNFLMLQSAYSELYFCDTLWPDFSVEDLKKAVQSYARRERRFGKTGEQVSSFNE